jgi:hypothetical protein
MFIFLIGIVGTVIAINDSVNIRVEVLQAYPTLLKSCDNHDGIKKIMLDEHNLAYFNNNNQTSATVYCNSGTVHHFSYSYFNKHYKPEQ